MAQVEAGRRRWRIAWLLGFGVLVNYFDRVNLAVAPAALMASFGLSVTAFGYLSAAYNWTYALCQLPVGVVLDRFGVRRMGRASTLVWSVASFWAALAGGIGSLFGARLLLGVGEAPTFPGNAKAIANWFPERERGLPTAMFDAAAKFASAIGVPLLGVVLIRLGWRWSFALTGMLSLVYFAMFSWVYREPEKDAGLGAAERAEIFRGRDEVAAGGAVLPLRVLLRERKVWGLTIGFGAYNYVFYLLLTWLPRYLSSALGVDLLHSFLYTGVPWLVATVTDLVVGGWLVDWLVGRGWDAGRVRQWILVLGTVCGLGILGAVRARTAGEALVWISVSIGGLAAAAPVCWQIPAMIAPRGSVGSVGGMMNFGSQLSAIAAPIATGYLVAAQGGRFGWAFAVAGVYLAVGIASYVGLLGRIEPMRVAGA